MTCEHSATDMGGSQAHHLLAVERGSLEAALAPGLAGTVVVGAGVDVVACSIKRQTTGPTAAQLTTHRHEPNEACHLPQPPMYGFLHTR